ncbi:MAG: T9SS type A sorting domain-containing protein [Bacteroidetes bacterium]|nr:T9SS type A sorting domain-containing protein [Bacteroidota bacterium]
MRSTDIAQLIIYTLQGKLVKRENLDKLTSGRNSYNFSVSEFEAGTYLVSVITGNKQTSAKFVVLK